MTASVKDAGLDKDGFGCLFRTREKAEALVAALGGAAEVADYADVAKGLVRGDVLMNSTSIGMSPGDAESPVEAGALAGYRLVFDAVYTPLETRLLKVLLEQLPLRSIVPLTHACYIL